MLPGTSAKVAYNVRTHKGRGRDAIRRANTIIMAAIKGPVLTGPYSFLAKSTAQTGRYSGRALDKRIQSNGTDAESGVEPISPLTHGACQAVHLYQSHQEIEFREYYARTFGIDEFV